MLHWYIYYSTQYELPLTHTYHVSVQQKPMCPASVVTLHVRKITNIITMVITECVGMTTTNLQYDCPSVVTFVGYCLSVKKILHPIQEYNTSQEL